MKQSIGIHVPPAAKEHYTIHLGNHLLVDIPELLPPDVAGLHYVIITDTTVKKYYGKKVVEAFAAHGKTVELIAFKGGEAHKNHLTKAHVESELLKKHYGRDTCIIALGGGLVGDMAGFIAATYMRGIPYIHVPTTLLAMLDSSIGGKTAINTPEGKNLIGAFWHPSCVIADLNCLETLPQAHKQSGWIEALKMFMIADPTAFKQATIDKIPTLPLIKRAIEIKAELVTRDPHEKNERAILNFGHTIGHAIEKATDYDLLHGQAVGYGILVETQISLMRNLITRHDASAIQSLLESSGIMHKKLAQFDVDTILKLTKHDKKAKQQAVHYVLLNGIGKTFIKDTHHTHVVTDDEVKTAWAAAVKGVANVG